ncbi:MAG: hypothetical protein EAZ55_00415 [Cytophagales bacterium]|nr:MAG: hypothetical protein EAZ55_00415 [Cytophagales bacterium]
MQKKKYTTWHFFFSFLFAFGSHLLQAQTNIDLANQYLDQQEYDKAISLYEELATEDTFLDKIYPNYLLALMTVKNYKEAEKLIKNQIRRRPELPILHIDYGLWYDSQAKPTKADEEYQTAINQAKKSEENTYRVADHFIKNERINWAEKMLLEARKSANNPIAYAAELADIYHLQNRQQEMIGEYLNLALAEKDYLSLVQDALQDRLQKQEDFDLLEKVLLERTQKEPNEVIYNELLLWLYTQQKLFNQAFIQAKAIDKLYREQGSGIMDLGNIALKNKDYSAAGKMFEYVYKQYPKGIYYTEAKQAYINAREEAVKNSYPIVKEQVIAVIQEYELLLTDLGRNNYTTKALRNMALLYAFYLDDKNKAIALLQEAMSYSRANEFIAECKTSLGDIYLLRGEPWESTLLYSQVEKDMKETNVGYEAKLKNAKLSYFKAEFSLAQEHLDILKNATSREIANDAMSLSLLIQDNTVYDTLGLALKEYSKAELMIFQNQNDSALVIFDRLIAKYPYHTLIDEIHWQKAKLLLKMGQIQDAIKTLEIIVNNYDDDILGDDAYFLIAKIYEEQLKDKTKAMEYYQNHLIRYKGSIYSAEARKRFRILRGDFVDIE